MAKLSVTGVGSDYSDKNVQAFERLSNAATIAAGAMLSLGSAVYFAYQPERDETWLQSVRRYWRDTWRMMRAVDWTADNWRELQAQWWAYNHDTVAMPITTGKTSAVIGRAISENTMLLTFGGDE